MSDKEIRRSRTGDPELDAIAVISQALEGMSRQQARRVLKWADERFTSIPEDDRLSDADTAGALGNFLQGMTQMAQRLNADPRDVLKAMARVAAELDEEGRSNEPAQESMAS